MISAERLDTLLKEVEHERGTAFQGNDFEALKFWGPLYDALTEFSQLRAPGLSQEDRARAISLVDWLCGYIPVKTSGTNDAVTQLKAILRRLGGQTT